MSKNQQRTPIEVAFKHHIGAMCAVFYDHECTKLKYTGQLVGMEDGALVYVRTDNSKRAEPEAISLTRLLLRPMETITHEELLEVCEIADDVTYGDYRYTKWIPEKDGEWVSDWKAYNIKNEKVNQFFQIDVINGQIAICEMVKGRIKEVEVGPHIPLPWDWYIEKGLDVPMQPGNDSLIDQGMALDINTFMGGEHLTKLFFNQKKK